MRQEFSKRVKLQAWDRCGGRCECGCGQKIHGDAEYDHIIECAIGGDNSLENCRVLRRRCHAEKTDERRFEIVKSIRIREKNAGIRKPKGRPLPGTKRSGIKKKLNGDVEWR